MSQSLLKLEVAPAGLVLLRVGQGGGGKVSFDPLVQVALEEFPHHPILKDLSTDSSRNQG